MQNSIPQKQCSKCGFLFPATSEFFYRDSTKHDGLHTICKACGKANNKVYQETHKEQTRERKRLYQETHKEQVRENKRVYRETHKEETAARLKRWQQGERYKEYQKQYHQEHREEIHTLQRQQYQEQREQRLEHQRHYRRTEQGRAVEKAHKWKRKAQKRASKGSYTAQQLQAQMQRQKSKCYYCKAKLVQYHVDHIVPLAHGGTNDIHNIVLACSACNLNKHARLLHEWPEGGRLL